MSVVSSLSPDQLERMRKRSLEQSVKNWLYFFMNILIACKAVLRLIDLGLSYSKSVNMLFDLSVNIFWKYIFFYIEHILEKCD